MALTKSDRRQQPLPKRSTRFSVGKEIGGAVYVHREYESLLPEAVRHAKTAIPSTFQYTVVKYVVADETVSFIHSDDFDESDEPTVGDVYTVKANGSVAFRRVSVDPWIYHHKWLFVADTYTGFDVEASKERSLRWLRLDDIDYRRIGKRSFWQTHVVPRLNCQKENIMNDSQVSKLDSNDTEWLRSDEARKVLRVSTCDLSHLRQEGKIAFRKAGNAYLYAARDCEKFARGTKNEKAH